MSIRASGVGVMLRYKFADGTGMSFRLSDLFSSNRALLELMIRRHGQAEIVNPEADISKSPVEFTEHVRRALIRTAHRLSREIKQSAEVAA
jgi:hypothetical protein